MPCNSLTVTTVCPAGWQSIRPPHGEPEVESSVIEWLLHDDQVMRECFTHAAEILKSVTGAAITAITLLDEEYQHYRAEVGMTMPLVTRARSLADYAVRDAELFVIEDAHDDSRFGECMLVQRYPFVRFLRGDCAACAERRDQSARCARWTRRRASSTPGNAACSTICAR